MIETVPNTFKTLTNKVYPPHNKMVFEEYFMNYFIEHEVETKYTYLPIMWTSFYIERKYGNVVMGDLQRYLDRLDRRKSYFTVIQYDDGILQNIDDLNIFVFGAGGGGKKKVPQKNLGYPIPLICNPDPSIDRNKERDIFCSFIGTIHNHQIRRKILSLSGKEIVVKDRTGYIEFSDIMERSVFSLCPRGYGATSFRICEALQRGSIPVYVYDQAWIPWVGEFDFNDIGVLVQELEIPKITDILKSKTEEDIQNYVRKGKEIYERYFTFEGCAKEIIKMV